MKKIWLCAWCINGLCSHGEKIYQGNEIDERECEECGEIDTCYECIEEERLKCVNGKLNRCEN